MNARWLCAVLIAALLTPGAAPAAAQARTIEIAVTQNGFEPARVKVAKGVPLKLVVTRKTDQTCAKEIVIPSETLQAELPLGKPVTLSFTPRRSGEITYQCGMNMFTGVLEVASAEGSGHDQAPSSGSGQGCDSVPGVPVKASPSAPTKPAVRPTSGGQQIQVVASPAAPTKRGGPEPTRVEGPRGVQPVPVVAAPVLATKHSEKAKACG